MVRGPHLKKKWSLRAKFYKDDSYVLSFYNEQIRLMIKFYEQERLCCQEIFFTGIYNVSTIKIAISQTVGHTLKC